MSNSSGGNDLSSIPTRWVFIDTSALESECFAFTGPRLSQLLRFPGVKLIQTEVTVGEIRRHLSDAASKEVKLHRDFRDNARVLRNSSPPEYLGLFHDVSEQVVAAHFCKGLDDFLRNVVALVIPASQSSVDEVFRRYFESLPPFAAKESKKGSSKEQSRKKHEFPDAFALEALNRWASEQSCEVYVVSKDTDMQEYCNDCNRLKYFPGLKDLLDAVLSEKYPRARQIKALIANGVGEIGSDIELEWPWLDFRIEDSEAEVINVEATSVEIENISLVGIEEDTGTIQFNARVACCGFIDYQDGDEPKDWQGEITCPCSLRVRLGEGDTAFEIVELVINDGESITIDQPSS